MSLFTSVVLAPADPILGLNEQFNADTRSNKINLAVGVYYDANGQLPLLACVKAAEQQMMAASTPRGYQPIDGIAAYNKAVQGLVFGTTSEVLSAGRVATVQSLGGTGALKIGADFLKTIVPNASVFVSDPTWDNHRALFQNAGFTVGTYPYYDEATRSFNFAGMLAGLSQVASGSIIVLHACCHNPTGYDLSSEQWAQVIEVIKARNLIPFLDMAYQGFGSGIREDGAVIDQFVAAGLQFFVSTSFSKNFSLYGERVGALSVVCESQDECKRVLSQLKIRVRTNYSNPPIHGAKIIATVLGDAGLRAQWEQELAGMRLRIREMRHALVEKSQAAGVKQDLSYITEQRGMFSYSGMTKEQMQRLRAEFGIYGVDSGRICVAVLNPNNIDIVAAAIAAVTS